ncbi:MAG TPA: gamma-glutamyltransferase [Ilumatobacter sp.]|nr:gamma-glutamyltransferase [Ilumatobacter sp.]
MSNPHLTDIPAQFSASGRGGLVASADRLATAAGIEILRRGGNAVDAAIATNAAMAVVGPHLCGIGGDLFALVHVDGTVYCLNASGRAGSGASAAALRDDGFTEMPFRHDIRTVTVPGCIDGWVALHARFGSLPLADLLAPATRLATEGFPASPLLAFSIRRVDDAARRNLAVLADQATRADAPVRLPGVARALAAVGADGRAAFYEGEFGEGLRQLGGGWFSTDDLTDVQAKWVQPLSADAFGVTLHTVPPNSQGYLTIAAARLATAVGLPDDPDDPQWAHTLAECAKQAGFDRPDVLFDDADGEALLAAIDERAGHVDTLRASGLNAPGLDGDTTYLCTADATGMGVSLIQSNASGFGSWLAEPNTGINIHNRGLGFSLRPGHPAELAPGKRPPHTLSPAIATRGRALASVFGTMGGDAQPQILLQLAARLFAAGQAPAEAIPAGRWALAGPDTGFDTWQHGAAVPDGARLTVNVEGHAPAGWAADLAARGHRVAELGRYDTAFGHAHAIVVGSDGLLAGAADPRTVVGSCDTV